MSNKEEPELSFREISKWFHLSLKDAAEKCNTSQSTLKRRCRKLNIKQWPFRKIQTLTHKVPGNLQNASQLVSLILQYLSQSPEAVNRFADKDFPYCTVEHFQQLLQQDNATTTVPKTTSWTFVETKVVKVDQQQVKLQEEAEKQKLLPSIKDLLQKERDL